MMKKLFSAAIAAVMLSAMLPAPASAQEPLKIMCIGDSITDGYVPEYAGSYRKFLYNDLVNQGYSVDMVGTKDGGWTPTYTSPSGESFEFDNENTGYSGYSVKSYPGRNGIYEVLKDTNCLAEMKPDVVTLQIGTNNIIDNHDMNETMSDYDELIGFIVQNIPDDSILIVSVIPQLDPNRPGVYDWFSNYRHSPDWQTQYSDEEAEAAIIKNVDTFNANVVSLVEKRMVMSDSNSLKVHLLANEPAIGVGDVRELLFDGVHPNNEGYAKMGHLWSSRITELLSGGAPVTPPTEPPTSAPTTEPPTEPPVEVKYTVADLVGLCSYLLGERETTFSEKWDVDSDGVTDTYDLVLMRRELINSSP